MSKWEQIFGIFAIIVVCVSGVVILLSPSQFVNPEVEFTITATGDVDEVAWGKPEYGFWGEENGAIDWKQMPYRRTLTWYNKSTEPKEYTYEYWFRERWLNGTEWVYDNHGPFFVEWPQMEYYREIQLNNNTVFIEMKVL